MYRPCIPLFIVVLGLPAYAQTTATTAISPPLTLAAALALSARANPQLSSARREFDATGATVLQARLRPNPILGVGIEDTRRDTRETTVQISQSIELGGKRQRRVDAAERGRDAASADLRARQADISAGVTLAFNDVLVAQERVRLAQEALDVAARVTATVARRVQAGKISPVDETRARVAEANVRLEALKANGELGTARTALASFWGSMLPGFASAAGNLAMLPPLPDWHALVAGLAQTPAVSRARSEIARRQALAQLEQSRRTPDLAVTVGIKRSAELGVNQAIFGVSVPLPLFDRNQGNVLEALRRTAKAGDDFDTVQAETHLALALAYQELDTARQQAQALADEILPGAQRASDAAVKGFEYGKFAYVDVLDAQRTLIQAKSQHLQALSDAHRAAAHIDRIVGAAALHATP
jgi:cobalt-zinc-cadmium efflux system outer membrane protein